MPDRDIERIFERLDKIDDKINAMSVKLDVHCESDRTVGKWSKFRPILYIIVGALLAYGGRGFDVLVHWIEPASKVITP